jgi:hypothetical protein
LSQFKKEISWYRTLSKLYTAAKNEPNLHRSLRYRFYYILVKILPNHLGRSGKEFHLFPKFIPPYLDLIKKGPPGFRRGIVE